MDLTMTTVKLHRHGAIRKIRLLQRVAVARPSAGRCKG
ncbi:hypothetical protein CPter291_3764 [Collimonas pratensis]|nr:hypothetical protein CPter291_3764 [Collimonas pratensis]